MFSTGAGGFGGCLFSTGAVGFGGQCTGGGHLQVA